MNYGRWQITNANLVTMTDAGVLRASGLILSGNIIEKILKPGESQEDLLTINLNGMNIYPGLINGHDSLLATYTPYRGENWPYINWLAWDNDLKTSSLFRERMILDVEILYRLGAMKNIFNGTTSVVDFVPEFVRRPFAEILPISLLDNYGLAHSMESYSLHWGDGIDAEMKRANSHDSVFIIQIAEGFDRESKQSLNRLAREGGLNDRSVLVHGLSLTDSDLDQIREAGASLVWTPQANMFLYNAAPPVERALQKGIPVAIGTDSAMSGSEGLLHDLKVARTLLKERMGDRIGAEEIVRMVTSRSAQIFRLPDRGVIQEGARADLFVTPQKSKDPYESLLNILPEEIFFVLHQGFPVLADPSLEMVLNNMGLDYETMEIKDQPRLDTTGLADLIEKVHASLGQGKSFDFLPVQFNYTENR